MILISCVENALGLLFNHRRCSRDRAVCGRILELAGNELWLAESSAGLFREFPEAALHIVPDMSQVPEGGYCFWELPAPEAEPEGLVLYFWNRDYPSDEKFVFPGGGAAGKGHACATVVAHVAKDHRLHIDRRADGGRNVVELAVDIGARVVPGAEHGLHGAL